MQVTILTKTDGPLTKRVWLGAEDTVRSDGSACIMSSGTARRFMFAHVDEVAALIEGLGPREAIALGGLRPDLPEQVEVTTKRRLNGANRSNLISRSRDFFVFSPGAPALALVDFDKKGMPPAVAEKLREHGGLWEALTSVLPALANVARVIRRSTSAGLVRTDTGEKLPSAGGVHIFVKVRDGSDIDRFLKALHARCWLAGLGWLMVGAGGQLLERSIVDRVVGSPERLVFEGAPVLDPPLAQDEAGRRPVAIEGEALDTFAACPPLAIIEQARLRELRAKEAARLTPEAASARNAFVIAQSRRLVERTGMALNLAKRITERQCAGILLPDVMLPFDDEDLRGATVADVLADPASFEDATLADPLEGPEYGAGKAKIMRRADGTPWVHSFAHGRTVYELKLDYRAAEAALNKAAQDEAADLFVQCILAGDLDADEVERLRNFVSKITGAGKRALDAKLQRARQERAAALAQEERARRIAERCDPRPQIPLPEADGEWLPQMQALNDVLSSCRDAEPPMRDMEKIVAQVRARRISSLHQLTTCEANREANQNETRLPPPEQLVIESLNEMELAELIERHIEYVDQFGRPVHLHSAFVKHYLCRDDGALPSVTSIAQLPIVLHDGAVLSGRGLDRRYGVVFRVPTELEVLVPNRDSCTPAAVARAMHYLADEWLCDVAADYPGKCILIAFALTILERALLPQRPAFFVTAGQRGGGKTTTMHMISMAALGLPASAAAWSPNEEERRKALFAYLGAGLPLLVWDNLARGSIISCPSIEKALTSEFYSDRVLGETEVKIVPAYTVEGFTGNNIAPRGDLASRSFQVRLSVNRADPENREFKRQDPLDWTDANRGRILQAFYTILLGNPRSGQKKSDRKPAPTRFKEWWDMVGSAVEHAAAQHAQAAHWQAADADPFCPPREIQFKTLFLQGEADDEQTSSLAIVLDVLRRRWPSSFEAREVATYAGQDEQDAIAFKAALEMASGKSLKIISSTTVAWRLKALVDTPANVGGKVLVLRFKVHHEGGIFSVVQTEATT